VVIYQLKIIEEIYIKKMANFTISGISDYVKTNQDALVKDVVLGGVKGDTIANLTKQLGIKTKERLNYLNVDPVLQDGSACGFSAQGSTVFTERDLETAQFKAQDEYCDKLLLGKFAEYQVKIAANKTEADIPFGQVIMDEIIKGINTKMERLVWLGDKSGSDLIDGFITLAKADAATVDVTIASGTSVFDAVKAVISAIPENILDKAVVFLSPALYRAYIFELVEKNFYHFNPAEGEPVDMFFPGTSVKVHKTIGLTGNKRDIYASAYENMFYGADLMNDNEVVKVWYDDNTELFKYSVRWNAGVMTAYPDMVVLGSAAADLV